MQEVGRPIPCPHSILLTDYVFSLEPPASLLYRDLDLKLTYGPEPEPARPRLPNRTTLHGPLERQTSEYSPLPHPEARINI